MDNIKNIREAVESYEDYQIAALLRENQGKFDQQLLIGKRKQRGDKSSIDDSDMNLGQ